MEKKLYVLCSRRLDPVYAAVQGYGTMNPNFDAVVQEAESLSLETEELEIEPITLSRTEESYLDDLIKKGYDEERLEEIYNFSLIA